MSYFRIGNGYYIGSGDLFEGLIVLVGILLLLGIGCWIAYFCIRGNDKAKPLCRARVKILEKTTNVGAEWYVVQFENGERRRMRNFHPGRLILTVGDVGMMEYRGITIESFRSEARENSTRR